MKLSKTKKGFTLIELLIVIAIIAILVWAFLPTLFNAPAKGRDTSRVEQVGTIQSFLLTQSLSGKALPATGCIAKTETDVTKIGGLINANLASFNGVYPEDPQPDNKVISGAITAGCSGQYGYVKFDSGKGFTAGVYAKVEVIDNGNIFCDDIKNTETPKLGKITSAAGQDAQGNAVTKDVCYLALIQ